MYFYWLFADIDQCLCNNKSFGVTHLKPPFSHTPGEKQRVSM